MDDKAEREQEIVVRWRTRIRSEALGPTLARAYPIKASDGSDETQKAIGETENNVGDNRDRADKPLE